MAVTNQAVTRASARADRVDSRESRVESGCTLAQAVPGLLTLDCRLSTRGEAAPGLDVRHVASSKGACWARGGRVAGGHASCARADRVDSQESRVERGVPLDAGLSTLDCRLSTRGEAAPVSQLRRAASSVPTNIAEGSKRARNQDYARFLNIAESSTAEVEYLVILVRDLGYIGPDASAPLLREADEIARMLHALRTKVEQET
jgi:four helix bundle protein